MGQDQVSRGESVLCGLAASIPNVLWEKVRDLTQFYEKNPYTNKKHKTQRDNTQTPTKTSITQRLRTDFGRSVGEL